MPTIGGLSFSKIGLQKIFSGKTASTTLNTSVTINTNKLLKNKLKNLVSIKPRLIDYSFYSSLGFDSNIVGFDATLSQLDETDKPMSPRLLNWVEPYIISGVRKTLFYTEVNSGLKVGDRIFIINGNYDSDLLIKEDKYKRGRDGYKVLFVDNCRIVLDYDYTGVLPWIEEDLDNFVKVHYVETRSDFESVNRQLTTRGDTLDYKFNFYQTNFIYTNNIFSANTGPEWGVNGGITQSGFHVRDDNNNLGIQTEKVLFSYSDTSIPYLEVVDPSGYYDGKPYYILTNNTGSPYGYIFYTASNSRWEHHQNFNPVTGAVSGDFWMTLGETGSVPISTSQSWVQAVDINVSINQSTLVSISNNWYNMTGEFLVGSFSHAFSPIYYSNNRLKVLGGSFTFSNPGLVWNFKENNVYKWEVGPTQSSWVVDVKYSRPILTKGNFRDGNFDGVWNVGLFGRQDKKITWTGARSTWNTGTLLNTNWVKGTFNSKFTLGESYFCEYDQYGIPNQKQNGPNNNGRGFNFIIDSDLNRSTVENATLISTSIGLGTSTYSIVEQHIINNNISYPNTIKKGYFDNCEFNNAKIENSEIKNARSKNTLFNNIKSINSYFKQSVVKNSDYISDEIIKILNYEELNISQWKWANPLSTSATFSQRNGPSHKLYKFYISKRDFERFRKDDYFYLKNIIINDGQKKLVNFFDKKFKLGTWTEYFDDFYSPNDPNFTSPPTVGVSSIVGTYSFFKRSMSATAYLSTPLENKHVFTTVTDGTNYWTELAGTNSNQNYSIDVFVATYDRDDNYITGLDFDRPGDTFTIYTDETIKFTYTDSGTEFIEIRQPSGYYDSNPYYILTSGTGITQSYIFYTASNSRWEQYQYFDASYGSASGTFWMSLGWTGSLPISSASYSWELAGTNTLTTITSSIAYNPAIAPPTLSPKVAISPRPGAIGYVIDSDFESGIIERSNWNSGSSINYNNDLNITKFSNGGGFYDLTFLTQSSTIVAKTGLYNQHQETSDDVIKVGNVMFLNSVDYDTTGKLLTIHLNNPGTGYVSGSGLQLSGGSGTQATVLITATAIGAVTGIVGPDNNSHTYPSISNPVTAQPVSTSGTGLTLNAVLIGSNIASVTVVNPGNGYLVGDVISVPGSMAGSATFSITSITNGEIISVTISNGGIQFVENELLTIVGGNGNAIVEVLSTTGSVTRLSDAYKITSIVNDEIRIKEIATSSTVISSLLTGGVSYTKNSSNRWGYLHTLKFNKTFVKRGLLRRTYLYDSLIEDNTIDLTDIDFNNILNFKKLINIENLFINNKNILSKASYVNSNIALGNDLWYDGLWNNSIWNSGTFSKGVVKESSWHNGRFVTGKFYQSKSFNAIPDSIFQYYDVDRIYSSWKKGETSDILANDRYSWRKGTFVNGEFIKSDWESGDFLNGRFYNSKWYSGTFSKGIIGDNTLSYSDTKFYNGQIKTAIVENATLYAEDTSFIGASTSTILWETGTFNAGIFGCDILNQPGSYHTATWNDGEFNGGEFQTNGKWKTGIFNGGKFISGFGWTYATTAQIDYGWEDGEFNGGEFGNANVGTNSIWFTGEFNAGKFTGRLWNDGVFQSGDFIGSATYSAVGGNNPDGMTTSNVDSFVDSFTSDFYGKWNSGLVTNNKDEFIKTKKLFTKQTRSIELKKPLSIANFKNMLWLGGTFSHPGGKFYNSAWLDGNFIKGRFELSSFNPYVKRNGSPSQSFNLNDDLSTGEGSCLWQDGLFLESEFYISQWKTGKFLSGTAYGMVWRNGTSNYMNAYNVFWEDGLWRNGNWFGSHIDYNGSIASDFNRQILFRGMSYSGTSSVHFWNVFEESQSGQEVSNMPGSQPVSGIQLVVLPHLYLSMPSLSMPSDLRLKNIIELVDCVNGINVYDFEYIDKPGEIYRGVIAQELLDTEFREAVILEDGYYKVDYSMLGIEFKKIS